MKQELTTIVVPVFKTETCLDRCLNSIVDQTYKNLEIILVDDGSPDRCPMLCEVWAGKDSRIKVVHKPNAGLGMARNTGIEQATGKYICFFDSDDYVALDAVEKAVAAMQKYDADVALYGMNLVDASGKIVSGRVPQSDKALYTDEEVHHFVLPNMIANDPLSGKNLGFTMSSSGAIYSLKIIQSNHWRFASEREFISEDFYSLLKLYSYVRRVAVIHEALYFYCYRENSLSHVLERNRYRRICHCYKGMLQVSQACDYPEEVNVCLDSQFLGSVIGNMKLIVASGRSRKEQRDEIYRIITDSLLQKVLRQMNTKNESLQRKILIFAIQHKMNRTVYWMLKVKNKSGRNMP